jgi:type IV pilus assembly protein PilB
MAAKKRLGEMLIEAGVIDESQLRAALGHQRQWGVRLGQALVEMKLATEADVVRALARRFGYEIAQVAAARGYPLEQALKLVPREFALKHSVLPLAADGTTLTVAMSEPGNISTADELRFRTGRRVKIQIGGDREIADGIRRCYPGDQVEPIALDLDAGEPGEPVLDPFGGGSKDDLEAFFGRAPAPAAAPAAPRAAPPAASAPAALPPAGAAAAPAGARPITRSGMPAIPAPPAPARPITRSGMTAVPPPPAAPPPRPITRPGMTAVPPPAPARPRPLGAPPPRTPLDDLDLEVPGPRAPARASAPSAPPPAPPRPAPEGEPILATDLAPEGEPGALGPRELELLDALGRMASGGSEAPEVVKPAQAVAALLRLLLKKKLVTEEELLEELGRR